MDADRFQRPALNPDAPVFVPRFSAPPAQPQLQQPPPQVLQKLSSLVITENSAQKETAPPAPVLLSVEPKSAAASSSSSASATIPAVSADQIQRPPAPTAENSTFVPVTNCTQPSTNAKVDENQKAESTWEDMEEENDAERTNEVTTVETKRTTAPAAPKPKKEHVNVIFIGHVDAGKSTIGGQLMYLTGQVDKRTLEKYEKEAREMNRESWYLSWALDTNAEEREKGKTVQVGRANFETERKHFTILDAPGHKSFVPNMIGGASQADLAVLVISARKGEFEAGLERGGQTREHAMLVKTAGVRHLVVLINKMDDVTVNWDKSRYDDTKEKLLPVLKKIGFLENKDLYFMPCSGYTGAFLKDPPDEKICSWYRGPSFIHYLDNLPPLSRAREGPVRIVLSEKYNDMGTVVMGKVESGIVTKGQTLLLMPNKTSVQAIQLWSDDDEADEIGPGENVKIKLKGVEEEGVMPGFVLCSSDNYCKVGKIFDAQVMILEHKSIICPGYSAVLHIHAAIEEVSIKALLCLIDRKTLEKTKLHPRFVKQDQVCIMRLESNEMFCLEPFKDFPQMGRFVLRDEGRTIAIGKVLKVIE